MAQFHMRCTDEQLVGARGGGWVPIAVRPGAPASVGFRGRAQVAAEDREAAGAEAVRSRPEWFAAHGALSEVPG